MVNWKTIAIIFIILFVVETFFIIWSVYLVEKDNKLTIRCLYDVCGENADAWYDTATGVCQCYDYDMVGNLIVSKTKILN